VEDRTRVATKRFKQNWNAKAHASVPAMDKVYSNPRSMKSVNTNGSYKPSPRGHPRGRPYNVTSVRSASPKRKPSTSTSVCTQDRAEGSFRACTVGRPSAIPAI